MKEGYAAPDIDTTYAQRQAGENAAAINNFISPRTVSSGAGSLSTGTRATKPAGALLNDFYFETDTHWLYYWGGSAWLFMAGLNTGTNATRAAITVSANDNGAHFFTTDQNKLWLVSGGAWTDRFVSLDLTTSLKVAGTKVIGARITGWQAFGTSAPERDASSYDSDTIATKNLAALFAALLDDLLTHGVIGA